METFIVLGFCFILYEALDFFQSCYTNNNRHHQQHAQFSREISTTNSKETVDNSDDSDNFRDVITSVPLSEENHVNLSSEFDINSSKHSYYERDDIIEFENIGAFDSEETIIDNQSNRQIYSICDRVNNFNYQQLIDYQSENKNSNFNDYDELTTS